MLKIYPAVGAAGNVIVVNANAATYASETVSFQHQTTGTGLWGATGIEAYFIKSSPSYQPDSDPRLPKHTTISSTLNPGDDYIALNNINLFEDPGFVFVRSTVTSNIVASSNLVVGVTTLSGIELGQNVTTANIGKDTTVRVSRIFRGNSSILLSNVDTLTDNVTIASGETIYFDPPARVGGIRIGQEVVFYQHAWAANGTVTSIIRNYENTRSTSAAIPAGTLVTALGVRRLPLGKSTHTLAGNLYFTASNLGLGYSSDAVVSIKAPDNPSGKAPSIGDLYLYANGAVHAIGIYADGTGYYSNPVITITGVNTVPFVGTADLVATFM